MFLFIFFSMRKMGTTKGTNLRINALFRYMMNVPLPLGICPLCVFSIKLCPIIGAKIMIHWDNFPGSTVPIKALM